MPADTSPRASSGTEERMAPLSFQQQWLWGLLQRFPRWNCVVPFALRLSGTLNTEILEVSFKELVRRHEALRTQIVTFAGVSTQKIVSPHEYEFEWVRLSGSARNERRGDPGSLVESFVAHAVSRAEGPLFRTRLFESAEGEYVLVVCMHHVITDGVSCQLMFKELWSLYSGFLLGRPASLGAGVAQYPDYAIWQRETDVAWHESHEAYWNQRLDGAQRIQLPVQGEASLTGSSEFKEISIVFGTAAVAAVEELCRRLRTVTSLVMLSAYVATIRRWCGQSDFVVPFNIAGRLTAEHQGMMGYLAHVVYLRMQVSGTESFVELVKKVGREFQRGVLHQDFGRMAARAPALLQGTLCQWLSWHPRELSGVPSPEISAQLAEVLQVEPFAFQVDKGEGPALTDIGLEFFDGNPGICARVKYRTDLFNQHTMEVLLEKLQSVVEGLVSHPERHLLEDYSSLSSSAPGSQQV